MTNIRPVRKNEYKLLEEFLYHVVFMPPGYGTLSRDVIRKPEISVYIEDFGKPDDVCLVWEENSRIVGAVWSRILAGPGKKGFGNIDDQTPELAISVLPEYRGRGIGTRLIGTLIRALRKKGYARLSLSVQKENTAALLYAKLGFQTIRETTEDYIMVLDLHHEAGVTLAAMSPEELWRLFPIELTEHDSNWSAWYAEERATLAELLGNCVVQIDHIGSTAVDGLLAKPIVDILLQVSDACDFKNIRDTLIKSGWLLMAEGSPYGALDLNKGYTPEGFAEKVFHLHVRGAGDWDEPRFRDYLRNHPDAAAEYAALKRTLLTKYKNNRDAYTEAKTNFIRDGAAKAKAQTQRIK